jgi:hypothetical protein
MNRDGQIYEATDVPAEDRARLEGYLRGRAEADAEKMREAELAEMQRRLADAEARMTREAANG